MSGASSRFLRVPFVVDTGSDVTLIPVAFARDHRLVGYDPATVRVPLSTSLNGVLDGYWGQVQIQVHNSVTSLPCFYYTTVGTGRAVAGEPGRRHRPNGREDGWFDRFCRTLLAFVPGRSHPSSSAPCVLGRAGLFGPSGHTFVIQQNMAVLSPELLFQFEQ
jgi:hypothetical protein